MNHAKVLLPLIAGILVALFAALSLYLRIVLPYGTVFVGDWIKFTGVDAYYHMVLVDNLVHTLPEHSSLNPFLIYPGGGAARFSFLDYLLAGVIWLVSLGSPTQHLIDVVAVYFPPIMAALTLIPVYFIGKTLLNRWAGVMAAGLIAIMPGEFLGRSILGFTDHHVAEVLFSTTSLMFLIMAIKTATQSQFTFDLLKQKSKAAIKTLVYSLFAGIFLGIYLLTWQGALLFVFIMFIYFVIQFIIDHFKGQNTDYLCFIGVVSFLVALLIFLLSPVKPVYLVSLIIAALSPVILYLASRLMARKKLKPVYYPLTLLGICLLGLSILYAASPSLWASMLDKFSIFAPSEAFRTIMETKPILFPRGEFSFISVWSNFTTGFFLSFISLAILIYHIVKRAEADKTLLVVWSLIILAATLAQRRFAYYLAVNVAVLTAYLSWLFLQAVGFKETTRTAEAPLKFERPAKKKHRERSSARANPMTMALSLIFVVLLVFYPNIGPMPKIGQWPAGTKLSIDVASHPQFAPSNAWYQALSWVKDSTPDPFADPDFYYKLHNPPFSYPQTAYGVTSWWDFGYWIARIGHRLPNCNPGQTGAAKVAKLFISQDEATAAKIIEDEKFGTKYVIIDYPIATSKFYALPEWADSKREQFYDTYYYKKENGQLMQGYLFHPEYYRSLLVRLYNFDGKAVLPDAVTVVSYEEKFNTALGIYKEIVDVKSFATYAQAEAFISNQKSGKHRIFGIDPFTSPVPLQELQNFKLVHSSKELTREQNLKATPEVKVFEYIKP